MKEKNTTSVLTRVLVNCGAQAKEYGSCVAVKVPEVERDMCLKEFLALKSCMQNVYSAKFQFEVERLKLRNMLGKASSSQSAVGVYGSGAVSHVYIQYPPLKCRVPGSLGLYYDDGNKLLLSPTSDQVVSLKTVPFTPHVSPTTDSISEGPVLSIRYSLDAKILAIQRSNHEVQFWNRETGDTFSQKYRSDSESLLGFFWTDCPTCDLVFVKTSGLDLFSYDPELKLLQLVETKRLNISWYAYTHESRLVLLASGMQCKSFIGYQLSSAGIIRLPRFEMAMAKPEANSKPVLAAEDVHIVTVYGRIYCLQIDRVAMLLHSYRFYRDAVVQQGSLPIYSSQVAVSVVDNVLLIHQVDAKVIILYDIFADSRAPISAPLPLLLRGFPRASVSSSQSSSNDAESSEEKDLSDAEAIVYGDDWIFLVPDLICDVANGCLWKIHLDLEAISDSSSDVPSVLEFLQRRKLEAKKAKQLCLSMTQTIILERRPVSMVSRAIDVLVTSYSYSIKTGSYSKGIKTSVPRVNNPAPVADEFTNREERLGKSVIREPTGGVENESVTRSTFVTSDSEDSVNIETHKNNSTDVLTGAEASQSQNLRPGNSALNVNISELQGSNVTSAAITTDELYSFVFAPVEEEMARDASYLVAIIVEFIRSANVEKVKVHPNVYVLTVRLLARNERYAELGLFIINKILEPSKEVALQLLESGRQNIQTRKLGMDMLRQLMLHHEYVVLLVQDGYYLEALRYARKNKNRPMEHLIENCTHYEEAFNTYREGNFCADKMAKLGEQEQLLYILEEPPFEVEQLLYADLVGVNTVQPSLFLEAAYAANDSQHVAAVLRFFSDFIPGFRNTSDHNNYCRILAEMNSSIAV